MLRVIFLLSLFFPFFASAKEKICLNMIVKNESAVIKRCLDSVKGHIDYWVIVDTGSTDGTQKIIKEHLKNIPGELLERPWKNFGYNRTEAIELAKGKGDFLLFMDADDILEFEEGFEFPPLTSDLYNFWRGTKDFFYLRPQLVRNNLPWKSVGVTHEYLDCKIPYTSARLEKVMYVSGDGGARSVGIEKFLKNIELLEQGLKEEPNNERYQFYLAESYRDAGNKEKAIGNYRKRTKLKGWDEEVFYSYLQIAHLQKELKMDIDTVINSYYQAHRNRPHRIEPIYYLAEIYNNQEKYDMAYETIKSWEILSKNKPKDGLFNLEWISKYGLDFQRSICAYWVGNYQESVDACTALLKVSNLPQHLRDQTKRNLDFATQKTLLKECAK